MSRNTTNLDGRARAELGVQLLQAINRYAPIEDIRNLIDRGAYVNTRDDSGRTSLNWACLMHKTEIANLLLNAGADVNIASHNGNTPLYWTSFRNNPELADALLKHGADVNIAGNDGNTPLYHACLRNKTEIANLILNAGADINLSLLKAFVRYDEWGQIDDIINNRSQEHINLHLREGSNPVILDMLYFPAEYHGIVGLIGNEGNEIELHFEQECLLK